MLSCPGRQLGDLIGDLGRGNCNSVEEQGRCGLPLPLTRTVMLLGAWSHARDDDRRSGDGNTIHDG